MITIILAILVYGMIASLLGTILPELIKTPEKHGAVGLAQAIGLAIDRKAYVNALHKGDAPTVNAVAKGFPGYVASLDSKWGYNVVKAKQLLKDAGYGDGFTFTVTYTATGTSGTSHLRYE